MFDSVFQENKKINRHIFASHFQNTRQNNSDTRMLNFEMIKQTRQSNSRL